MFAQILQDELSRRKRRRPSYSLRAFARDLAIQHGTLSQLLSGARRPTPRTIEALGSRIGLDAATRRELCLLATDSAVLGAVARDDFRPDSRWLASRTGIPLDAVNVALHRLLCSSGLTMSRPEEWRTHGRSRRAVPARGG